MDFITEQFNQHRDEAYREFMSRLIPTVPSETVLGVRTPVLRAMAKQLGRDARMQQFFEELPHTYFEENQLHSFLIGEIKDFSGCIRAVEEFLPYIDNWATCDQLSPKVFKKHRQELLPYVEKWLESDRTYTVRFAIGMLMQHFLDGDFKPEYLALAAGVRSGEYYVNMEIAWYMATALAKQWDAAVTYLEEQRMEKWVHNRTIQKARESYRITEEQKAYLKTLRQ